MAEACVTAKLIDWLIVPERLTGILASLHARKAARQGAVQQRLGQLQQEAADTEKALANLYRGVESRALDLSEPSLQTRVQDLRARRDLAQAALDRARAALTEPPAIDAVAVEEFAKELAERLSNGAVEARKAWLNAIVDTIIVEPEKIRVVGKNDNLEQNLRSHVAGQGSVRSSDREWWAGPHPQKLSK